MSRAWGIHAIRASSKEARVHMSLRHLTGKCLEGGSVQGLVSAAFPQVKHLLNKLCQCLSDYDSSLTFPLTSSCCSLPTSIPQQVVQSVSLLTWTQWESARLSHPMPQIWFMHLSSTQPLRPACGRLQTSTALYLLFPHLVPPLGASSRCVCIFPLPPLRFNWHVK